MARGPGPDRSIERTLSVWQPRASTPLTAEDAREIAENVTGLFKVLREWAAIESRGGCPGSDGRRVSIATEKDWDGRRPQPDESHQ